MATMQAEAGGFFRNPGREVARLEDEVARRLRLLGIAPDDRAGIRRLLAGPPAGKAGGQHDSTTADLLGLGLLLVRLLRQSASAGRNPGLGPTSRAFIDGVLGRRSTPAALPEK
ncbi:hypothetical protein ACLIKD_20875 [Azonexus sp. IMCC34842]|uniref:hypothetical protein n=1 Tax=Azonexus sp. IMCC34842 TaxID=3420950 RepID=UPI003D0EB049